MKYSPKQLEFPEFKGEIAPLKRDNATDNELITWIQSEYLKNRSNKKNVKDLIFAIKSTAKRMINHERVMKGFFISSVDATEKSFAVAEYIFEQYITRPNFKLQTPSAYIYLRVLAVLYRHKKIDRKIRYTNKEF